ncbi:hypothetical protein [Streptomyces plumbiresistens]|uniref:NACHT domain-containing protein n=1 Tax=Streptomyces plumbiresistens TaxID=511811 RepID=A0ABP7QBM2_9ACTN
MGAFALLVAAGFSVILAFVDSEKLVALVSGAAAELLGALVLGIWALLMDGSVAADDSPRSSAQAADALAREAVELYDQRQRARNLVEHEPVPVRWVWSRHQVFGRPEDVIHPEHGVGSPRFAVLPNAEPASPAMLAEGGLSELFNVYAGVRSGRVVVLGEPGSGKSAAAVLTVLKAAQERQGIEDERERERVPVPVLLTPKGWNPKIQRVQDWLADRLVSDFKALRAPSLSTRTPAQLISEHRIALFLDGFDDIDAEQLDAALLALRELSESIRLVIFSRNEQFTQAAQIRRLPRAAVLELQPVPAGVAADCLSAWQPDGVHLHLRQPLAERVREEPDGVLARALRTPLMLTLLRDAFPHGEIDGFPALVEELLTPGRFRTPEDIHDRLLKQILHRAYPPDRPNAPTPYTLDQAQRWLGRIAQRMTSDEAQELAWWRMHEWASAAWRILAGIAGGGLAAGLIAALVGRFTNELGERTVIGVFPAAVAGAVLGLATGIVTERRAAHVSLLRGSARASFNAGMGLMSGLAVGSAVALTVGPASGPVAAVIAAPVAALTAGIGTGFAAGLLDLTPPRATTSSQASPLKRFLGRLVVGLPAGLATGVPAGLAGGIPLGLAQGTRRGLVVGLAIGIAYVLAFGLLDGFARIAPNADSPVGPKSAWNEDRKHSLSTGVVFGLAMGFAAGLTDSLATARHDPLGVAIPVGLITGVVVGVVTGTAAGLTVSNSWRTMVVFVQLWVLRVLPLRAMRFLEDARERDVLRETGPFYEFRHARLKDYLARQPES